MRFDEFVNNELVKMIAEASQYVDTRQTGFDFGNGFDFSVAKPPDPEIPEEPDNVVNFNTDTFLLIFKTLVPISDNDSINVYRESKSKIYEFFKMNIDMENLYVQDKSTRKIYGFSKEMAVRYLGLEPIYTNVYKVSTEDQIRYLQDKIGRDDRERVRPAGFYNAQLVNTWLTARFVNFNPKIWKNTTIYHKDKWDKQDLESFPNFSVGRWITDIKKKKNGLGKVSKGVIHA